MISEVQSPFAPKNHQKTVQLTNNVTSRDSKVIIQQNRDWITSAVTIKAYCNFTISDLNITRSRSKFPTKINLFSAQNFRNQQTESFCPNNMTHKIRRTYIKSQEIRLFVSARFHVNRDKFILKLLLMNSSNDTNSGGGNRASVDLDHHGVS